MQWIAVNVFFVALNALAAGLVYGLFRLGQLLVPGLMEEPFFVYPIGILAIAGAIWIAWKVVQVTGRLAQGRGRGRA